MRRFFLAILFCLSAVLPIHAQEPERLYFPLVVTDMPIACTKPWRLITPEASTNYVLNPSAETTGNYAVAAAGVVNRVTTWQHYGLYSYSVTTAANGDGISLTTSALAATAHYVTLRVHGTLPPAWRVGIGAASKAARKIETIDPEWTLYGVSFSAAECSAAVAVTVTQSGAGAGDFYLDGVQVEPLGHWTTYIDGTQEGCAWLGAAHASASERSGQALAGGELQDLWDEYHFFTEEMIGVGSSPLSLDVRNYAILPGGELAGRKIEPRQFTLIGRFIGHSEQELHEKRKALIQALSTDSYAEQQPVRLRFAGARVQKEIDAYYEGGLEAELPVTYGTLQATDDEWRYMRYWTERVSIQFLAEDPMFYEVGESAELLDTEDSDTFRVVAARLRSTGQWDNLGPPAAPGTAVYTRIFAVAEDETYIYYGGDFTDFDNNVNADRIVRWHKQNQTWSPLGTGMNSTVYDIEIAADGTVYAAGDFTTAGGGAASRIASWNGAAWAALGAGTSAIINDIVFGLDGTLYVTGNFTLAGGAGANRIASWDGAAWSPLGTGLNGTGQGIAVGPDGTIYVTGNFTTANGVSCTRIAAWDGSNFSPLGSGFNVNGGFAVIVGDDGTVFVGGDFTTAGGDTANYIAQWNGTAWYPLGSGMNNRVFSLEIGPDGMLYAGGEFTTAGGITLADRIARWNGSSWAHLDINLPGTPIVDAILASPSDPVVEQNYNLWIGFNTTGMGYFADIVTVADDGSRPAYPKVVLSRSGGTSATLETLKNETTGLELLFDYDLLDGEILTVNLKPTEKSIVSSMFGDRMDAILPNSDFGQWTLKPGSNDVTAFVDVAGAPTIVGYLLWKDTYNSLD